MTARILNFTGSADIRATMAHHCTRGGADSLTRWTSAVRTVDSSGPSTYGSDARKAGWRRKYGVRS